MSIWVVLVAGIASWMFGAVYYGLLGKFWMQAHEFNAEQRAIAEGGPKANPVAYVLSFVSELVMAFILAMLLRKLGATGIGAAVTVALTCWAGFVATTIATNNAYGQRKMSLTIIDAGHWLGVVLVQALVLSLLG